MERRENEDVLMEGAIKTGKHGFSVCYQISKDITVLLASPFQNPLSQLQKGEEVISVVPKT